MAKLTGNSGSGSTKPADAKRAAQGSHAVRAPKIISSPQAQSAAAVDPSLLAADCVIPARAGGGFALTCALARDALQAVRDGKISNAASIIALQWLALNRAEVRGLWQ